MALGQVLVDVYSVVYRILLGVLLGGHVVSCVIVSGGLGRVPLSFGIRARSLLL